MKNILIVFTVLAMASVANAAFQVSIDGVPALPESEVTIMVSDIVVIDIHSAGEIAEWSNFIVFEGTGSVDMTDMSILSLGIDEEYIVDVTEDPDAMAFLRDLGYDPFAATYSALVHVSGDPMDIPEGPMIDGLRLHCEAVGDVIVSFLDGADGALLASAVIHQIPEPITFALLGLGGLFLRRRK